MASAEKRILIINPDRTERTIMAFFLKNEKFDVETGTGLADAVKKIREGDFGCLILDVNLPEMKGYEAVPILKRIVPEIKIIMTAKKNTKSLEAKIRAQDIFFYYIKSFSKDELIMALNSAFRNLGGNHNDLITPIERLSKK
ncbi:MAG: response regulator [Candidatus Aminicenantes bacterium]|nr:response regulator [Candidatus Aminicenantes bacterium]MDH5384320.1 response regulator [Candidatus Aminicenantes bacterium]